MHTQPIPSSQSHLSSPPTVRAWWLTRDSRNLRKVQLLLEALEAAAKEVDYYALDLSKEELDRTLRQVPTYRHVRTHGLLGTYDDGREWLKTPDVAAKRKCIMSLGSSIGKNGGRSREESTKVLPFHPQTGNFQRDEAADFLRGFADVLQPNDTMIVGLDSCTNPSKV